MIHSFTAQDSEDAMNLDRRLYSFFVGKTCTIMDVKQKIRKDFGFDVDQLQVFFRYEQELKNTQYLLDVPEFDIEEDIIMVISLGAPKIHLKVVLREALEDIKIADVRFLNSRDKNEPGG